MKQDSSILLVCDKACDQCLYGKNKIVSDERKEEILEELHLKSDYFICHKASMQGYKTMCRGYYDRNKHTSFLIRLGHLLSTIKFIDVLTHFKNKEHAKTPNL